MTTKTLLTALLVAIVGVAVLALGWALDPDAAASAYLTAWVYGLMLALGSLVFLLIGNVASARWFIVLRRASELASATFPMLFVLGLPVLLSASRLFPWARPLDSLSGHAREAVERHPVWSAPSSVLLRSLIYFGVWIAASEILLWTSRAQRERPLEMTTRLRFVAGASLWPFALTTTFAGFDWVMSLAPGFGSTTFGLYLFSTAVLDGVALLVLVARLAESSGALRGHVNTSHYYALGRLLLTFVIFWAYIAFTQLLIVYMGDLPEEAAFYITRTEGAWYALGIFLVVGRFGIPFFALLSRELKLDPSKLTGVAAWILVGGYADVAWLVLPSLRSGEGGPTWVDLGAVLAVGGALVAFAGWRARGQSVVPEHDPDLAVSEAYRRT